MSSSDTIIPPILDQDQSQQINDLVPIISTNQLLDLYYQSLSEKERRAYIIAKSHLGSTFDLSKSVGFVYWKSRL